MPSLGSGAQRCWGLVLGRPARGEGVARGEPPAQATVASFSWSLFLACPWPSLQLDAVVSLPSVKGPCRENSLRSSGNT